MKGVTKLTDCTCRHDDRRWLQMCEEHKAAEAAIHAEWAADHAAQRAAAEAQS